MAQRHSAKARSFTGKVERLEARINRRQKRLIERAAELRGTSVTDFVLQSVQRAAGEALREYRAVSLGPEASRAFVKALLNPPAPNAASKAAARRHKTRLSR